MTATPKIPRLEYPEIVIWKQEVSQEDRLHLVNADDFPVASTLKGLGLDDSPLTPSFATADREEIEHRLSLIQWLIENPSLQEIFLGTQPPQNMPGSEQKFVNYADSNPYWTQVRELLAAIMKTNIIPGRIVELARFLEASLPLETLEQRLYREAANKLLFATVFEGYGEWEARLVYSPAIQRHVLANDHFSLRVPQVHGYRLYNYGLESDPRYPAWTKRKTSG